MQLRSQTFYHPDSKSGGESTNRGSSLRERCVVYTPPGYDDEKGGAFPVVYLLHGVGDNEFGWELNGRASSILDNLLEQRLIEPMVVVMPFGFESEEQKAERRYPDKVWFDGYLNRLIKEVEAVYRLQVPITAGQSVVKRAVAGLSMGGKQALEFGLNHLELISAIGNFSGALHRRPAGFALPDLLDACRARQEQVTRLALFYHACGREDGIGRDTGHLLVDANRELVQELERLGIPHVWHEIEGQHDWTVWRECLSEFLPMLTRAWAKEIARS
jgi:enterochelin esterase-like enzyme